MTPVAYLASIEQQGPSDFLVRFADVPEAISQGDTLQAARLNAYDALQAALEGYLEMDRALPARSEIVLEAVPAGVSLWDTAVDPKLAARARVVAEMKVQGVSNVGLAKLMGRDEKAVRLILGGRGASLEKTLEALRALGVRPALAA